MNGREIKTVVQNAVTTAFARATSGGKEAPLGTGTRWISPQYFVDEAKRLVTIKAAIGSMKVKP